jgi:hypothetical protein
MAPKRTDAERRRSFTAIAKPDDPAQYKRFLEAAQNAEADETEEGANKAFKRVTRPKEGRRKEQS